jgi:pimeloyl-ACP methyl ester carboxylesterase
MTEPTRVVCLHGLRRTAADWDAVRAGLPEAWDSHAPELPARPGEALSVAAGAIHPGDVVCGHSMGAVVALRLARERRVPLSALVLTGSFFPPARNGRGLGESVRDYAGHRRALVREMREADSSASRSPRSARALGLLLGQAVGARRHAEVRAPVLVVHARDDHHVPVDFARAAVAAAPGWELRELERGGHHAHVDDPPRWLGAVLPWLGGRV